MVVKYDVHKIEKNTKILAPLNTPLLPVPLPYQPIKEIGYTVERAVSRKEELDDLIKDLEEGIPDANSTGNVHSDR